MHALPISTATPGPWVSVCSLTDQPLGLVTACLQMHSAPLQTQGAVW